MSIIPHTDDLLADDFEVQTPAHESPYSTTPGPQKQPCTMSTTTNTDDLFGDASQAQPPVQELPRSHTSPPKRHPSTPSTVANSINSFVDAPQIDHLPLSTTSLSHDIAMSTMPTTNTSDITKSTADICTSVDHSTLHGLNNGGPGNDITSTADISTFFNDLTLHCSDKTELSEVNINMSTTRYTDEITLNFTELGRNHAISGKVDMSTTDIASLVDDVFKHESNNDVSGNLSLSTTHCSNPSTDHLNLQAENDDSSDNVTLSTTDIPASADHLTSHGSNLDGSPDVAMSSSKSTDNSADTSLHESKSNAKGEGLMPWPGAVKSFANAVVDGGCGIESMDLMRENAERAIRKLHVLKCEVEGGQDECVDEGGDWGDGYEDMLEQIDKAMEGLGGDDTRVNGENVAHEDDADGMFRFVNAMGKISCLPMEKVVELLSSPLQDGGHPSPATSLESAPQRPEQCSKYGHELSIANMGAQIKVLEDENAELKKAVKTTRSDADGMFRFVDEAWEMKEMPWEVVVEILTKALVKTEMMADEGGCGKGGVEEALDLVEEEMNEQSDRIEALEQENAQLKEHNRMAEDQNAEFHASTDGRDHATTKLAEKIADLLKENAELEEAVDELMGYDEEEGEEEETFNFVNAAGEIECLPIDRVAKILAATPLNKNRFEKMRDRVNALKQDRRRLKSHNRELEEMHDNSQAKVNSRNCTIVKLNLGTLRLKGANSELAQQNAELTEENMTLKEEARVFEKKFQNLVKSCRDFDAATTDFIDKLKAQTTVPDEESEELTSEDDTSDEMNMPLRSVLNKRDTTIVKLKEELGMAQEKCAGLEDQVAQLESERASFKQHIGMMRKTLALKDESLAELTEKLENSEIDRAGLAEYNNKLLARNAENEAINATNAETNTRYQTAFNEERNTLIKLRWTTTKMYKELTAEKEELKASKKAEAIITTLRSDHDKKDVLIFELQEKVDLIVKTNVDLQNQEAEVVAYNKATQEENTELRVEQGENYNTITQLEKKVKMADKTITDLQRENADIKFKNATADGVKATLNAAVAMRDAGIKNLNERLENRDRALDDHRVWIKDREEKIKGLQEELSDLKMEIDGLVGLKDRLGRMSGELEDHEEWIKERDEKIKVLEAQLRQKVQYAEQLQKLYGEAQFELVGRDGKIEGLETALKDHQAEVRKLETTLSLRDATLEEQTRSLVNQDSDIKILKAKTQALESKLDHARRQVNGLKEDLEWSEAHLSNTKQVVKDREETIKELEVEGGGYEAELEDVQTEVRELKEKLKFQGVSLGKTTIAVAVRNSEIKNLQEKTQGLEEKLANGELEISKLKDDSQPKYIDHENRRRILVERNTEIAGLKNELVEGQDEIRKLQETVAMHENDFGEAMTLITQGKFSIQDLKAKIKDLDDAKSESAQKDAHIRSLEGPQGKLQKKEYEIEALSIEVDELKDEQAGVVMDEYEFVEDCDYPEEAEVEEAITA